MQKLFFPVTLFSTQLGALHLQLVRNMCVLDFQLFWEDHLVANKQLVLFVATTLRKRVGAQGAKIKTQLVA